MVICRPASPVDMSALCAFGKQKHAESNYAVGYNAAWFRKVLMGVFKDRDQCVFLTMRDGEVSGLLIGCRMPMLFSPFYCATDAVFVADAGGDLLLDRFIDWCRRNRVRRIDMGNSQGDRPALDRLMKIKGLQRSGGMYHMNIEVPQ